MSAASVPADAGSGAPTDESSAGVSAPASASASVSGERRRRRPSGLAVGFTLIAVLVLVRIFVAEPFRIPSESMQPTLRPGDQALVTKLGAKSPHRGDLIAFHAPQNGEVLLKRVVAVAGDSVGLEDGVLVVNGRQIREAYADPAAIDSIYFGPVKVRPGTVFVLGDNRANSEDSRDFGAVRTDSIIGRAVARVWPPSRWASVG